MSPLKKAIFQEIRNNYEKSNDLDDVQMNNLIFHHPDSLRLSYSGFIVVKNVFTAYSFELPLTLKSRHNFGMSKLEYPYFFTRSRLILFSEGDAMIIKLCGGVEQFLEKSCQFDNNQ